MSTVQEVRAAEKKLREVLEALKKAGAQDPNDLGAALRSATDEYAKTVHELRPKWRIEVDFTDGR
jgi:hypothetical protein